MTIVEGRHSVALIRASGFQRRRPEMSAIGQMREGLIASALIVAVLEPASRLTRRAGCRSHPVKQLGLVCLLDGPTDGRTDAWSDGRIQLAGSGRNHEHITELNGRPNGFPRSGDRMKRCRN